MEAPVLEAANASGDAHHPARHRLDHLFQDRLSRVRLVERVAGDGFRVTSEMTVEVEGQERPALVAEVIGVHYA